MGYFSNGTEAEDYRNFYCYRCVNWRDVEDGREDGCPIMDLHFLYNGDQFNAAGEHEGVVSDILTALIPLADGSIYNGECSMFQARAHLEETPIWRR